MGIDLALQGVEAGFEEQVLLFFELHLDAEGVPDLERDADDDGGAEADQNLRPIAESATSGEEPVQEMRERSRRDRPLPQR